MLAGLRVVDLTDERGEVGPYLLADLGAEVVRVEVPGRGVGQGWREAYNLNKVRVAAPGDGVAEVELVGGLVAGCDVVFDCGPVTRLERLGLGRDRLLASNPMLVQVVVSPFGCDGPRAFQAASELTVAALGGAVWLQGSRDRAPVGFSVPQTWRHAGAEAAVGALVALARRDASGEGQFVDVSAQAALTWTLLNAMEAHGVQGREFVRDGSVLRLSLPIQLRLGAADGWVVGVPTARLAGPLSGWLIEEGIVAQAWAGFDWGTYDHRVLAGEEVEVPLGEVTAAVGELCGRYRRDELFRRGLEVGATLAPLNDVSDLLGFDHLDARSFWAVDDGGVRWPGVPVVVDGVRGRARRSERPGPVVAGGSGGWRSPVRDRPGGVDGTVRGGSGPVVGASLPFEGLRVLDLSWIGVGPITARVLGDHGATVVRVESESRLDGLRSQPPYKDGVAGVNRSNFFGSFNTSKLGVALDLKVPAGRDLARRMAGWADVVIESFTPGTIDRLGLGYGELSASNPSLVMVSTSLLGPGSEVSCMAGYGYHAAAVAGFQDLVGWPDRPPDGPWLAYTDTIGPRFILPALLGALRDRAVTGVGCHLDASQLEMALQFLAPELARFQVDGTVPVRVGNRHPVHAPQGVYPTRGEDRWVAVTVLDDGGWSGLVGLLGRPGWATGQELATAAGRRRFHDRIDEGLAAWTGERDGVEVEAALAGVGVAAGVVQTSADLLGDAQFRHRGFYRVLEHGEVGPVPYAGHQFRIEGYDGGPRWAAPCLGQDTWEVLTEVFGLDPDEVADLAVAGVLT